MVFSMEMDFTKNQGRSAKLKLSKSPKPSGKGEKNKILRIGLSIMSFSLFVAAFYYLISLRRSADINSEDKPKDSLPSDSTQSPKQQESNQRLYTNSGYSYSVEYPSFLYPREVDASSRDYLSFVRFEAIGYSKDRGFAIGVREAFLEEEAKRIIEEIEEGSVKAKFLKKTEIISEGFLGVKLDFEPKKSDEGGDTTIIIVNNGKYSYSLSASPNQVLAIFSSFKLLGVNKDSTNE